MQPRRLVTMGGFPKRHRADHNGLKGKLFDRRFAELNIGSSATPPVCNSAARSGMPNLRPTVEIGRALDLRLWRSGESRVKLDSYRSAGCAFAWMIGRSSQLAATLD